MWDGVDGLLYQYQLASVGLGCPDMQARLVWREAAGAPGETGSHAYGNAAV